MIGAAVSFGLTFQILQRFQDSWISWRTPAAGTDSPLTNALQIDLSGVSRAIFAEHRKG
jgi:hypothetical protein